MLALLRANTLKNAFRFVQEFFRDLNWFSTFLAQYNGVTFYVNIKPKYTVQLDACLTALSGSFAGMVYSLAIPHQFNNYSIVHLEI